MPVIDPFQGVGQSQRVGEVREDEALARATEAAALKNRGRKRPVYTNEQKNEMRAMHARDVGYRKIAAAFGCSVETVKVALYGTRWRKRHVENLDQLCSTCGSTEDLSVDHIVPLSDGGSNGVENIRILCMECNRKNHSARAARLGVKGGRPSGVRKSPG